MTLQHFHKQNVCFFQAIIINYRELFLQVFLYRFLLLLFKGSLVETLSFYNAAFEGDICSR